MGQNIYNGYYVRAGADGEPEFVDRAPGFPKTGSDWPVTPEAFYYGIKFLDGALSAAALHYGERHVLP